MCTLNVLPLARGVPKGPPAGLGASSTPKRVAHPGVEEEKKEEDMPSRRRASKQPVLSSQKNAVSGLSPRAPGHGPLLVLANLPTKYAYWPP